MKPPAVTLSPLGGRGAALWATARPDATVHTNSGETRSRAIVFMVIPRVIESSRTEIAVLGTAAPRRPDLDSRVRSCRRGQALRSSHLPSRVLLPNRPSTALGWIPSYCPTAFTLQQSGVAEHVAQLAAVEVWQH